MPQLDAAGRYEHCQQQRLHHSQGSRRKDEVPLIDTVRNHPGREHEDRDRQELECRDDAQRCLRVGQLDDEPRLRDRLHPRPCQRNRLPRIEEPVVAVPQCAERLAQPRRTGNFDRRRSWLPDLGCRQLCGGVNFGVLPGQPQAAGTPWTGHEWGSIYLMLRCDRTCCKRTLMRCEQHERRPDAVNRVDEEVNLSREPPVAVPLEHQQPLLIDQRGSPGVGLLRCPQ